MGLKPNAARWTNSGIQEFLFSRLLIDDGCWNWVGCKDSGGYGVMDIARPKFHHGPRTVRGTHRLVYEWIRGKIKKGFVLDHLCKNRACANPDHVEQVTVGENFRRGDRVQAQINKTHCFRGHLYTETNTYQYKNSRACRECMRIRGRWEFRREHELPLDTPNLQARDSKGRFYSQITDW